ncbi:sodium-dependent transporter [Pseudovibrio sp. Tun.PSC04-5.I4]|uniref:sodium-dependent transporter n=1 Tax=Pseudovibrio sp. Tun.PSC04-5.I4 TaxID=1798213 RepID=UPI00088E01D1|nr:sodium-dependent transporter [Pseudovibrio sp. Tun.PSC04-5.I4]SDR38338.1 neurotransmitter:Na+ symporter, NSS family [Pseudovibrio sp. Tun.PSC04-5.I4]
MKREQWGSRFGFIMAAAGSAVGLGNIWKFPYLAGTEGGGAFLAVYLLIMATIGVGLIMAEIAIGRAAKLNPVGAFRALGGKLWMPTGILGVVTSFLILSFYSVVGGWTIAYLVKSVVGSIHVNEPELLAGQFTELVSGIGEPILYHGAFMVLTIGIVLLGVAKGIERAVKVLMPLLFVLLMVLVVRSVTLPGAWEGIEFFLVPDWSQVDGPMIRTALGQAFFSLSLGMGAMITYGSYLDRGADIPNAAYWVVFLAAMVAVLGGLLVLPAVFAFGMDPAAGPGLTFITLPAVFGEMIGGYFFQILFFAMLLIAALTSSISLLAIPVAYFAEEFRVSRKWSAIIVGFLIFLLGIPCSLAMGIWGDVKFFGMNIFDLMAYGVDAYTLPLGGILTALFAGWIVLEKVGQELTNEGTLQFGLMTSFTWIMRIVAPMAVLWVMVSGLLAG